MKKIHTKIVFTVLIYCFFSGFKIWAQGPEITKVLLKSYETDCTNSYDEIIIDIGPIDSLVYTEDTLAIPEAGKVSVELLYDCEPDIPVYCHLGCYADGTEIHTMDGTCENGNCNNIFSDSSVVFNGGFDEMNLELCGDNASRSKVKVFLGRKGPPLLISGCRNCGEPVKSTCDIYCFPESDVLKFYVSDEDSPILDQVEIYEDGQGDALVATFSDLNIAITESEQEINLPLTNTPLEAGQVYYLNIIFENAQSRDFYFEIACCEGEDITYSVANSGNTLPYFTSMHTSITVDNMPEYTENVTVEAEEEVIFQAGGAIVLLPGFETEDNAIFHGYITECTTIYPIFASRTIPGAEKRETGEDVIEWAEEEELLEATFQVYPNPSSRFFNVVYTLDDVAEVQLDVFSMLGKRVMSFPVQTEDVGNHKKEIDLLDFPHGSYIVKIKMGNITHVEKILYF